MIGKPRESADPGSGASPETIESTHTPCAGLERVPTDDLIAELAERQRQAQQLGSKRSRILAQVAEIDEELNSLGVPIPRQLAQGSTARI